MADMRKHFFIIFYCFLLSGVSWGKDAHYLIEEMESLRDSLSLDDPARVELTLRLADLYFDISIKEGGEGDHKTLRVNRLKALNLYKHSLNGTGRVKKAKGLTRIKIEFQMARLLTRLNEHRMAERHYFNVVRDKKTPQKMSEQSFLALAEWYEEDGRYRKAVSYYDKALKLCSVRSACNYAHYRKGWLYFKDTQLDLAIREMKSSLWASEKEVREPSLTDLLLFMSNADTDGLKELGYIKKLSTQLKRPELIRQLTEAYYVAGNRRAGSNLLAYLNEQNPNLYYEVRLLEEFYGFRNWNKVDEYLKVMENRSFADIPQKKEEASEVRKIFRRFLVQVDSETQVISELNNFLKRSIDIYLSIYLNDELRKKLQQGWLKAEKDEKKKVERLGRWIREDLSFGFDMKSIRQLRQSRLSLAQKLKMSEVVIEESLAIAKHLKGHQEADEFTYVAAREQYGLKNYFKALPLFISLVDRAIVTQSFSKWAILSQNLILDIFNHQKNYKKIIDQVERWQKVTEGLETKEILREKVAMNKILIEARFEKAVQMLDSPKSLQVFYDFCFQKVFIKKSCSNAKVLAVKFRDQEKLVKLLEREGNEKALMVEYEIMGRFSEAARLQEKINLKPIGFKSGYDLFLKIALLYELDQNWSERNRVLKMMLKKMKREREIPKDYEDILFLALDEANLIGPRSLSLAWSLSKKLSLASRLELERPNKKTQKILLGQKENQGPVWSKLILKKIQKSFASVGRIKFYGRRSRRLFKRRNRAIERFAMVAKSHLEGADLETRVYLLHMLKTTYQKMVEDIMATPLPPGLDSETLAQVQEQLRGMALPFEKVYQDYDHLLEEQMNSFEGRQNQLRIRNNLKVKIVSYADFISLEKKEKRDLMLVDYAPTKEFKKKLLIEPANKETLSKLLGFYQSNKMVRLAAYYTGRLENLKSDK